MWLITPIGFYSIVEKPEDRQRNVLTVRARVRSDLIALKKTWLPTLGKVSESSDTDYRYRAKASRADVAGAMAEMIDALDYSNFKSEVAAQQGHQRAHLYHDVWSLLHRMQGDPRFEARSPRPAPSRSKIAKADAYGGVVINERGEVLLVQPTNHFGGYVWTFPKGRPEQDEPPDTAALREVAEETGHMARIIAPIPGAFAGTTTATIYFLMEPVGAPGHFSEETAAVRWASEQTARKLIRLAKPPATPERDLRVLNAALTLWRSPR